jgi:hypothetical protein
MRKEFPTPVFWLLVVLFLLAMAVIGLLPLLAQPLFIHLPSR